MAVVLADNLLVVHFPQPSVVVGTSRDQVSRVGAECTIPHPALMALQRRFEGEGVWILLLAFVVWLQAIDCPNLGGVIRAACRELLDVG